MTARIFFKFGILLTLAITASTHAQGRLQSVREGVREPDEAPKPDKDHHHCDDDEDDWGLGEVLGEICVAGVGVLFHEFPEPHCYLLYPRHPYQHGFPDYMIYDPDIFPRDAPEWAKSQRPRTWAARVSVEDCDNFTDLNRFNGEFFVESICRLGLLTRWNRYQERLPNSTDSLLLGDTCVTWRWLQTANLQSRIGVGMTVLDDRYDTNFGATFLLGVDLFPVKPVVCTGSMEAGFIGEANFFHGRATIGVTRGGWELFTGYDYLHIGATRLQGPLLGIRYWF